jgi:riboflavin biosynthesis pyrimidine reductase
MASDDLRLTFPQERALPLPVPGAADDALADVYSHPPESVRLNLIASAEGKASGPDGSSRSINGPADLRVLRAIRAWADVILVGARTARGERYTDVRVSEAVRAQREARGQAVPPQLAIVTWSGELPPNLSPGRTWVVAPALSPAARGLDDAWAQRLLIAGEATLDPWDAVAALREAGMSRIVCEGGPHVAQWFLDADAVDEYCLTRSPLPGGADAALVPPVAAHMTLAHRVEGGGFAMERWTR